MELKLSASNPNTRQHSESAFVPGGVWDQKQGREQTRLFAECFHRHVKVPYQGAFSMLDVGCGLGDSIPLWRQNYPEAQLFGCDVAQVAVDRCLESYGMIGRFFRASFEEIRGNWDVIYCSNVLEHFEQHAEIANCLLSLCRILYVMTPYAETRDGKPLTPESGEFHVATLDKMTFSTLERSGKASVTAKVVRAPGAWSPNWKGELKWALRRAFLQTKDRPPRQIIYAITNRAVGGHRQAE